jgi:hypothetical protein
MASVAQFGFWLVGGIVFFYLASVLWQKVKAGKEDIDTFMNEKKSKKNTGGVEVDRTQK